MRPLAAAAWLPAPARMVVALAALLGAALLPLGWSWREARRHPAIS
jgi:hypothetical protein